MDTIGGTQATQVEDFRKEILQEAEALKVGIEKLREKVSNNHSAEGMDQSFLKSNLDMYLKTIPTINLKELTKLINKDVTSCKANLGRSSASLEKVMEAYERLMAQ